MNTLYDYYKSIGQNLPSVTDRQSIASKAGISGYTGSKEQNGTLLSYLQKGNSTTTTTPTTTTTTPVTTPTTPTTPTNLETAYKSVGDLSGLVNKDDSSTVDNILKTKTTTANSTIDEDSIRKDFKKRIQEQIDGINNVYASMLGNARIKAQNNVGMTRAVNARSGLLGSDFASADEKNMDRANQEVEDTLLAEQTAKINALLSGQEDKADTYIQNLKAEKEKAQSDVLSNITTRATARTSNASKISQYLLTKGITDLNQLSPDDQKKIEAEYGVDPATLASAFTTELTNKQKNDDTINKDRYKTIADGAYLYDSQTGKIIENPKSSTTTPFSTSTTTTTGGIHPVVKSTMNLMGIDSSMATSSAISQVGADKFVDAVVKQEGGSPKGVVNNPGNIKYAGLPGQINSGVKATDGGTFASYATPQAGKQAVLNWFTQRGNTDLATNIAKYKGVTNPPASTVTNYSPEAQVYINSYKNGTMDRKSILDSIPNTEKFASFRAEVVKGLDESENSSVANQNTGNSVQIMDDTIKSLENGKNLVGTFWMRQADNAWLNPTANEYTTYLNNVNKLQQQLLRLNGVQLKTIFGPQISNADASMIKEIISNALNPKTQTKEDFTTSLNQIKAGLEKLKTQKNIVTTDTAPSNTQTSQVTYQGKLYNVDANGDMTPAN